MGWEQEVKHWPLSRRFQLIERASDRNVREREKLGNQAAKAKAVRR